MKKYFFYFGLLIVIAFSFAMYSSVYYPLFNSDDGVTLLMLHHFDIKKDFYFWGQDRVGSIIPLLGQLFYKGFGMSSIWAESITHLIILLGGYFSLASFLKTKLSKIVFAIIWFLPIPFFLGLVRYSFGLQYSLVGIGFYLINKYQNTKNIESKVLIRWLYLICIFIAFTASVWVTDTAIVTIGIVLMVLIWNWYRSYNFREIPKFELIYTAVSLVVGVAIILLLKSLAIVDGGYEYNKQIFNSYSDILSSLSIIKDRFVSILSFSEPNVFVSIYTYLAIIVLGFAVIIKNKSTILPSQKTWYKVFLMDGFLLILIVILSHWAFLNGVARRYFVGSYIVFWLAFLIWSENISIKKYRHTFQIALFSISFIGVLSIVYGYKYVYPKRLSPKAEIVKEFEQLGKIGIISEYWNSYGTSFVNPDLIKATPHDKSAVRNYELVDSVFNQPRLFVIKDMWLDAFPDTLYQFGYTLVKKDSTFFMGDCYVNEYEKLTRNEYIPFDHFKYKDDVLVTKEGIQMYKDRLSLKDNIVVWGPYLPIGAGNFSIKYSITAKNYEPNQALVIFDVVADYGKTVLQKKELIVENNDSVTNLMLEIEFESKKRYTNVEFRSWFLNRGDITIKDIQLVEK